MTKTPSTHPMLTTSPFVAVHVFLDRIIGFADPDEGVTRWGRVKGGALLDSDQYFIVEPLHDPGGDPLVPIEHVHTIQPEGEACPF